MHPDSARTRHCTSCRASVVDVSLLTRREAEELVRAKERGAKVCVHLHVRRDDGAILLADGHALPERPRVPDRRHAIVAAASAIALAACAPSKEPEVPNLVPVVAAPASPGPVPAPAPPPAEPTPTVAAADEPDVEPAPAPAPSVQPIAKKPTPPSPTPKGKKPPTYDVIDGGI